MDYDTNARLNDLDRRMEATEQRQRWIDAFLEGLHRHLAIISFIVFFATVAYALIR